LQARFGADFLTPEEGWQDVFNMAGANVIAVSAPIVAGVGTGTVRGDTAATDFTGHPYAQGSALKIETNHYVRFFHNGLVYEWAGPRPVLIGVGGTYPPVAADFAVATESVDGIEEAAANDQTFGRRNSQWVVIDPQPSGVTPGTYQRATLAIDQYGVVTAAETGAPYPTQDDILTPDLLIAMAVSGIFPGWDTNVAGPDEEFPSTQFWTKGSKVIRATYTYAASGEAQDAVQTITFDISYNGGSTYGPAIAENKITFEYSPLGYFDQAYWSAA
jgi:hypothetical protein